MSYINRNYYKPGCWNVICDVCGVKFKSDEVLHRWDGLIVCKRDWEPDHPQKYIRVPADPRPVPFIRQEPAESFILVCTVLTSRGIADQGEADCARAEEDPPVEVEPGEVVLLITGDGTNGSTSILDSSTYARAATVSGTAQISTAQAKFDTSSISTTFSGSSWVKWAYGDELQFGEEDLTFELFFRPNDVSFTNDVFVFYREGSGRNRLWFTSSGQLRLDVNTSVGGTLSQNMTGTGALSNGTWYFAAWARQGDTWRAYFNETKVLEFTKTGTLNMSASNTPPGFAISGNEFSGNPYNGYCEQIRVTKGYARYTTDTIVVPTTPFPIPT